MDGKQSVSPVTETERLLATTADSRAVAGTSSPAYKKSAYENAAARDARLAREHAAHKQQAALRKKQRECHPCYTEPNGWSMNNREQGEYVRIW